MVHGPGGMPPQGAAVQAQPPGPPGMPRGPGAAPPPAGAPPLGAGSMPPPPMPGGGAPPRGGGAAPPSPGGGPPPGGGGAPPPGRGGPPPTAPLTDRPPQPLPANPRPMPPQPETSTHARQQAVMLRLMEDKGFADRAAPPAQAHADVQSQLLASDVQTAPFYLHKLGAHTRDSDSRQRD